MFKDRARIADFDTAKLMWIIGIVLVVTLAIVNDFDL
jgi:hypothetical protein